MTEIRITRHAAERYVERINPRLTIEEATAQIATSIPALRAAVAFGCAVVIQGRAKLVLEDATVVTVMDRRQLARGNRPPRFWVAS